MAFQAPTRIMIEVHQPHAGALTGAPVVHVTPVLSGAAQPMVAAGPREDVGTPAAFDPGECRCMDDDDCLADHAND